MDSNKMYDLRKIYCVTGHKMILDRYEFITVPYFVEEYYSKNLYTDNEKRLKERGYDLQVAIEFFEEEYGDEYTVYEGRNALMIVTDPHIDRHIDENKFKLIFTREKLNMQDIKMLVNFEKQKQFENMMSYKKQTINKR